MKIIIPGGTGEVGQVLIKWFRDLQHDVVVLSRSQEGTGPHGERLLQWDGKTPGPYFDHIDGADAIINLAGRSVNCRYTKENLRQMMDSRVDSTRVIGRAIAAAENPPPVWLQMSTATIYAHRFDAPNDEHRGIIGGDEPDVPDYWAYSVEIAQAWEAAQQEADTPSTRKVALRTAMVMSPTPDSVFGVLCGLTRKGLGGAIAGGDQYVSWIHEEDFARAVHFLLDHDLEGPVNLASPSPLPQREHMATLRDALGISVGLPAAAWMVRLGAVFLRTDAELVLKSRRVIPGRLTDAGFAFRYPRWEDAAPELVRRLSDS